MLHINTFSNRRSRRWSLDGPVRIGDAVPDVYLPSHGHNRCDGTFRFEQVLRTYAFHVIEAGAGVFELDGQAYEVEPGALVLVRPGVHARYYDRPATPWEYRWFTLQGIRVYQALAEAGLREDTPVLRGAWNERFAKVFARIEQLYETDIIPPSAAMMLGWEVIATIAEACAGSPSETPRTLPGRALFIMQQEYHRGLQVDDLARRLRVSRATLFRHFRATYGRSPKTCLDDLRLSQAHELLQRGTSTVKEVSYACGFRSPHYFSRAYRNRYGVPPSRTRGRGQESS